MNAEQIREIIRQELAAFFGGSVPALAVSTQEARDKITHALNMPRLLAETNRQRLASAERKARKAGRA